MAAGWPTKANYATGDVLTAANMNDLSGTVNYIDPTSATDGQVLTRDAASAGKVKWANAAGGFWKNPILNSNFSVWQRGTSGAGATSATTGFMADRWQAYRGAYASGLTVSRQTTSDTTNLPIIQYCARVQRDSGNTNATDAIYYLQTFETSNSIRYAGQTVAISFYARKGANFSSASSSINLNVITGTGTDQSVLTGFTGQAVAITGSATLTTTWQRFTVTGSIGSTATQIALRFDFGAVGTAGAADYFEITGVQLEIGSSATAYYPNGNTYQAELAACQRYCIKYGGTNYYPYGTGFYTATTNARIYVHLPVQMRGTITLTTPAASTFYYGIAGASPTAVAIYVSGDKVVTLDATVSGMTAGNGTQLYGDNSANSYLLFTSEL